MIALLVSLAWRSVLAHRAKSLTLAASFVLNAALLVLIGAAIRSSSQALEHSLTESFVGHLEVYSAGARDELDMLVAAWTAEQRDSGNISDYAKVAAAIEAVPEVRGLVPMGMWSANIRINSPLNDKVQALRRAVEKGNDEDIQKLLPDIRQTVSVIREHVRAGYGNLSQDPKENAAAVEAINRAASDEFWASFAQDPRAAAEFLDTKVVRWAGDSRILRSPVLGVDFDALSRGSGRFELVSGKLIPEGQRGILLEYDRREAQGRHPVLMALDDIAGEIEANGGSLSVADMDQRRARLVELYDLLALQIPAAHVEELRAAMTKLDPALTGDLSAQLRGLLAIDSENFAKRRAFVREVIAPMLRPYSVDIGDVVTINTRGRDGAPKSVRATVFGTYRFRGVQLAKHVSYNLVDFATFREVYGEPTTETIGEMAALREEHGTTVANGNDEAAIFAGAFVVEEKEADGAFDKLVDASLGAAKDWRKEGARKAGSASSRDLVPVVVVWLRDGVDLETAKTHLQDALANVGQALRVSTWKQAAARFATQLSFLQVQIFMGGIAVFLVTLIVANLGVVIATAGREGEIGTLRAQGASRTFVTALLLCESFILSGLSAIIGTIVGVVLVNTFGRYGIPASSPAMEVIFGGPRLFLTLGGLEIVLAVAATVIGGLVATAFPAIEASSTEPSVAMRQRF